MSKLHFSAIIVLLFTLVCLIEIDWLYKNNYPKIMLPEKAHNTIGEIPFIEHLDDGQIMRRGNVIRTVPMTTLACTTETFIQFDIMSCDGAVYSDRSNP